MKCILLGFFLVRLKAFNGIIFSYRINEDTDLIWATTPTGWSVLLIQSFYGAWSDGAGTFVHYKKVTPREALKTLQEYPITVAQFRPSIYIKALDEGSHDSFKFPTLKRCFVAGEPSNKEMLRRWREKTALILLAALSYPLLFLVWLIFDSCFPSHNLARIFRSPCVKFLFHCGSYQTFLFFLAFSAFASKSEFLVYGITGK